ncbi:MAG: hypothetical protein JNM93_02730 [Bacteriovoracaceae bacterium]|nr:hypothetical protein [Bacteriovoracaceae bacterium]
MANELTLYFIRSPHGINWESGTTLARSIIRNYITFEPNFMGHVNIEIKCDQDKNPDETVLTGMIARKLNAVDLLFRHDIGMGILFHSFEGHLETRRELLEKVQNYLVDGDRINFVTFKISAEACTRLKKYHKEYKENGYEKRYGLYNRPLYKEGSGCSAFGASFLELIGLLDEDMKKNWTYSVKIPFKYIGLPLIKQKVSFLNLLWGNNYWASESEPHKEIFFWDPDKMYQWVKAKYENPGQYQRVKKENSIGLYVDLSQIPTPKKDIWLRDTRPLPEWKF